MLKLTLHPSSNMPELKLAGAPSSSPSQSCLGPLSETPMKETNKRSIFHSLGLKSRALLSSPNLTSHNSPCKIKTPSLMIHVFSESLAKIPNILARTLSMTRSPKTELIEHRRICTTGSLPKRNNLDSIGTSEDFTAISIPGPESSSDLRMRSERMSQNGAEERSSTPSSLNCIAFPQLGPQSPERSETEYFSKATRLSKLFPVTLFECHDQELEETHSIEDDGIVQTNAVHTQANLEYATAHDRFLHIARFLQRAARHARDQDTYSQGSTFAASAPLLLFIFALAIGVFLPRYYRALQSRFGSDLHTYSFLMIFGGAFSILLVLRGTIWVLSIVGQSLCEVDLSGEGDCITVDGMRMGEAELVLGTFLFG